MADDDPRLKAADLRQQSKNIYNEVQKMKAEIADVQRNANKEVTDLKHDAHDKERQTMVERVEPNQAAALMGIARKKLHDAKNKEQQVQQRVKELEQAIKQRETEAHQLDQEALRLEAISPGAFI